MSDRTLYCYYIRGHESIEIKCYEIKDYSVKLSGYNRFYIFDSKLIGQKSGQEWINASRIDRVTNGKLYTFDPDYAHAIDRISERYNSDYIKSLAELNKCTDRLKRWNEFLKGAAN